MQVQTFISRRAILSSALLLSSGLAKSDAYTNYFLFENLTKLAEAGNAEAQYHLGMLYNNGVGTQKNLAKAFELFTTSEKSGNVLAAYKAGCYYGGQFPNFMPVDKEKALAHKLIAAQAGYSIAQQDVSLLYLELKNTEQAFLWLHRAANQGFYLSLLILSGMYEKGEIVKQDDRLAYKYALLGKREYENDYQKKVPDTFDVHLKELAKILGEDAKITMQEAQQWEAKPTALTLKARAGLSAAMELIRQNQP